MERMLYREAIGQSLVRAMEADPKVLCMGVGVTDPKGIFGTTLEAKRRFPARVLETPLSENMLTASCTGMAIEGWKPVMVHARVDFLMITMEHLVNTAGKWPFMSQGRPLTFVVRALIGRGWGQGPQHSQALHSLFAHIPGLNVVLPASTPGALDALPWALAQSRPTLIIESRRMYETDIALPETTSRSDADTSDVTVAYISSSVLDVMEADKALRAQGIKLAVFGLERIAPLQLGGILASVERSRRLVVVDVGHASCGISAEIVARVAEAVPGVRVRRVTPPFVPCPTSHALEQHWYPGPRDIVLAAHAVLDRVTVGGAENADSKQWAVVGPEFKGPF
ncbi:MAG: alpha-ketoacid dehydrogenase subunit beta [Chloroflexi bacterium]|nr:alpha-ketoacid dehydrogenase subunit beta [Chloroflexota bacterium]